MSFALKDYNETIIREVAYKLLSTCFDSPVDEWKSGGLIDGLVETLSALESEAVNEALKMQEYFHDGDNYNDLHVAYAKLFVGPHKLLVPPYGSVYLDDGRRVMGDSTMSVLNFYRKIGIKVSDREVPDHIRIELEVMYYLLFKERQALREGDGDSVEKYRSWQREFFVSFLYPWTRKFAHKLKQSKMHEVYTSLGIILDDFMDKESDQYKAQN